MIKNMIKYFLGRKAFQRGFEKLHVISLLGMNCGGGGEPENSGELKAMEQFIQKLLKRRKEVIIFDVGANTGRYASMFLSRFGEDVLVYCFEPSRSAFSRLTGNLSQYKNVKLLNFGFGNKNEETILYSDGKGSGLGSVFKRKLGHLDIDFSCQEKVQIKRMDEFCMSEGIEQIDVLKLDVEGNEMSILNNMKDFIDNNRIALIQFEFGGTDIDSRTFFQDFFYLLNPNYEIYRILKDGLRPLRNYKETLEIFVTTNFLALNRKMNRASSIMGEDTE